MIADAKKLTELLLKGQMKESWAFLQDFIIAYEKTGGADPLHIFQHLLTPAMQEIGFLWETNQITVADEHIASNVCDYLIAQYNHYRSEHFTEREKRALLFCVEGEEHDMGLKMVSGILKEAGYRTDYLGANLPLEYALSYADKTTPDVVALSGSIVYHMPQLIQAVEGFKTIPHPPSIIAGGRLASVYNLKDYIGDGAEVFEDLASLHNWLRKQQSGQESSVPIIN